MRLFGNRDLGFDLLPRPRRDRLTPRQIERRANALVDDMRNGSFPVYHPLPGRPFTRRDDKRDHDGFIEFLMSDDFESLMREFREAGRIDGIEGLTLTN